MKKTNSQLLTDARRPVDDVPPEWRTARQIARDEGYSPVHIHNLLQRCLEAGTWEQRKFRIDLGCVTRAVPHYRRRPDAE